MRLRLAGAGDRTYYYLSCGGSGKTANLGLVTPRRYGPRPPSSHDEEYWLSGAKAVLMSMLDREYAVTVSEMEARASDYTWDPLVFPHPVDPHWFVNARRDLAEEGLITSTALPTRSHPGPITTWHRPLERPRTRLITDASQRKRLLTARHNGWSQRGGSGIGLIGRAGELALDAALRNSSANITGVTGSAHQVLGVDLRDIGEIDNSAFYVDTSDPSSPVTVQLLFEVKNTRQHYYPKDDDLRLFLRKAAIVQEARPAQLVLPVFVCRRRHYTLWAQGEAMGFLPVQVYEQLVLPDNELTPASFEEVRQGLGYGDLRLGGEPTNRHLGIARTAIPKWARQRAELWKTNYVAFLEG